MIILTATLNFTDRVIEMGLKVVPLENSGVPSDVFKVQSILSI